MIVTAGEVPHQSTLCLYICLIGFRHTRTLFPRYVHTYVHMYNLKRCHRKCIRYVCTAVLSDHRQQYTMYVVYMDRTCFNFDLMQTIPHRVGHVRNTVYSVV